MGPAGCRLTCPGAPFWDSRVAVPAGRVGGVAFQDADVCFHSTFFVAKILPSSFLFEKVRIKESEGERTFQMFGQVQPTGPSFVFLESRSVTVIKLVCLLCEPSLSPLAFRLPGGYRRAAPW